MSHSRVWEAKEGHLMKPGYNGNSGDWTSPDPQPGQQQGIATVHGPGLARER